MFRLDSRGVFLATMALCLVAPRAAIAIVALALCAQGLIAALQVAASVSFRSPVRQDDAAGTPSPVFSVHIATHEEPLALVSRTVRSLAEQVGAPDFEVIVLDNNTANPALWKPVADLCDQLGPRFRFFHEDGVKGAKAGALNIALSRTDPAATHVVIVDADYEVSPDFLTTAAAEIARRDDDFFQFPQAYRNDGAQVAGISLELADYFHRHAPQADGADAMLLTGTLSVIRRSALEAAGRWSGDTITEDAELGLRLRRLGFRGRFVDRVAGRGLLPLDVSGLAQQRYRWAAGNVGTILTGFSGLPLSAALHVAAQLTAWTNFALPMAAGLIGGGLALAAGLDTVAAKNLASLSGFGLLLVGVSVCLPLFISVVRSSRARFPALLVALASRLVLVLPSAMGTVDALLGCSGGFRRTSKDVGSGDASLGPVLPALALAGLLLPLVPGLPPLAGLGALLLVLPFPFALGTRRRLSAYRASLQLA
ncbi:glycosyltransferase family 2 protein [Tepidamorphus sp. 3E244]|uniref:glycosyltransferase family 2 protein n=1 Tax=Tepidamorphus sp. 3E244 TaxID=3385498 RepID=UPI0038FC923F